MRRRELGAFVNHSVQFLIVALAIWGAIAVAQISTYLKAKKIHQCALRLDGTNGERTCAASGVAFTVEDGGRICDPSSQDTHKLAEPMCATAEKKAAEAHPKPGLAWPIGVVAVSFVLLVGAALFLV